MKMASENGHAIKLLCRMAKVSLEVAPTLHSLLAQVHYENNAISQMGGVDEVLLAKRRAKLTRSHVVKYCRKAR